MYYPNFIETPSFQQQTLQLQLRHALQKLDQRITAAIDRDDRSLLSQLRSEKETLEKQLTR